MRIENEIKLGFKDVMFRPKRSTLKSRSEVTIEREFTFLKTFRQKRNIKQQIWIDFKIINQQIIFKFRNNQGQITPQN